ncbi:OmpA family protein [Vulcaniibacterium tengchongense]|uniref:OOP family OmpA-OmpF porin n=1 Tax=Vulcaniibacterium tengchongense TaxID=1273429 RepID=A0A3N4V3F6_9GAMM|nr:OmpA family protein [Vulcaniibacterium tengchongense]RPE77008.1 OOP family OmpA-OmpF porin [Vulcaniibacterium tengchongense]
MTEPRIRTPALRACAILMLLACLACSRGPQPHAPSTSASEADAAAVAPAAQFDARLSVANNGGRIRYDGQVGDEAARHAILAALERAYGRERIDGRLGLDPRAKPPGWLDGLPAFLAGFDLPGAAVVFAGRRIELGGRAAPAERAALLERAQRLYPGYAYAGLFEGAGAEPAAAAGLAPGADAAELVAALNRVPVRFEPGSARIDSASLDLLSRAAGALQARPEARLEIVGPYEATGLPEDDRALSQQRAEAIKVQLIVNGAHPAALVTRPGDAGTAQARFRLAGG